MRKLLSRYFVPVMGAVCLTSMICYLIRKDDVFAYVAFSSLSALAGNAIPSGGKQ